MGDLKLNNITPDGVGKIKLGSTNVQKIYNGSTLVWPFDSSTEDPYTPVEGQNFRFIARKSSSPPYFGLFDDTLTEVSSPYTFASLPDYNTAVGSVSDNFTYMIAAGIGSDQPVQISTNNGQSWTQKSFSTVVGKTAISKNGKVMIVFYGLLSQITLQLSNDFGNSFNRC